MDIDFNEDCFKKVYYNKNYDNKLFRINLMGSIGRCINYSTICMLGWSVNFEGATIRLTTSFILDYLT